MSRRCTVCDHKSRNAIDSALVEHSGTLRELAKRYGVSVGALSRHKEQHLPPSLAKAQEAAQQVHVDNLLSQLLDLKAKTLKILSKAEKADQLSTALMAIGKARELVESLCKVAIAFRSTEKAEGGPLILVRDRQVAEETKVLFRPFSETIKPLPDSTDLKGKVLPIEGASVETEKPEQPRRRRLPKELFEFDDDDD